MSTALRYRLVAVVAALAGALVTGVLVSGPDRVQTRVAPVDAGVALGPTTLVGRPLPASALTAAGGPSTFQILDGGSVVAVLQRGAGRLGLVAAQAGALPVPAVAGVEVRQTPDGVVPARALWTGPDGALWQLVAARASSLPVAAAVPLSLSVA